MKLPKKGARGSCLPPTAAGLCVHRSQMLEKPYVLWKLGSGEAMHAGSRTGRKALSSCSVSPAACTNKA